MPTFLYIFIDESGNHTTEGSFVVAACWCMTEYDDPNRILRPTKNKISDNVVFDSDGASPGRELKGTVIGHPKLNSVMTYLRNISSNDSTILTNRTPWRAEHPVRYTVYETDAELSDGFANGYLGEGRRQYTAQIIALLSVLSPLLRLEDWYGDSIDEYRVLLDAETWETPSTTAGSIFRGLSWAPDIHFSTYESHEVPGIQLADIAAHSRRRRLQFGDCLAASRVLDELRL